MAIKELFNDNRPAVLFDPKASGRIDPRFRFTRNSSATYVDDVGVIQVAGVNGSRVDHDPSTGESLGLLLEKQATNLFTYSEDFANGSWNGSENVTANATTAPDGKTTADKLTATTSDATQNVRKGIAETGGTDYCLSVYAKAAGYNLLALSVFSTAANVTTVLFDLSTGAIARTPYSQGSVASQLVATITPFRDGFYRCSLKYRASFTQTTTKAITIAEDTSTITTYNHYAFTGNGSSGVFLWGAQHEVGSFLTSYIPTGASAATRGAELLSIEAPLPASGSVYIDARAITTPENGALISLKNDSDDKIDLAYLSNAATFNSLALVGNYDGTTKTSLPLPVPTTNRERNILTWGANNYQYTKDSSRFAPSLSSSVPTGLNKLSIGHDAVDPTKAFNGYINTIYAWSGELTPTVAEALVRNDFEPINADTFSPVGPAGSLSLVINTQGASSTGEKTFTLPAESAANDNDLVITWGDGTESGLEGAAAELGSAALTHTYPSAGIYAVFVEGKMQNIQYNNIANANDLLEISAWGTGEMLTAPSTMANAFYGCTKLNFSTSARTTNLPDTSAVTGWFQAFYNCSSITGTFPAFNFSAATSFNRAWRGCSGLTAFTAAGDQTQNVTNFSEAWRACSGLTSFPLINTSKGTSFFATWQFCTSLTSFPLINTALGTSFNSTWYGCSSLTSFPLIDTSAGTDFNTAWRQCSSLTSFPSINTGAGTDFGSAWLDCSSLTSFPPINTGAGTNFSSAWQNCSSLTSFPFINTGAGTSFANAWNGCSSLTSFPLINTSAGTNFGAAWFNCVSLTSFPLINTGAGTNFSRTWYDNNGLTAFPALDFDSATGLASDSSLTFTGFRDTWFSCGALTTFPANLFDNTTCTRYLGAFQNCALTAASIENIIVSIEAAGTSNGNLSLQGGTNAGASTWTANAVTAYNALVARGWTITRNA